MRYKVGSPLFQKGAYKNFLSLTLDKYEFVRTDNICKRNLLGIRRRIPLKYRTILNYLYYNVGSQPDCVLTHLFNSINLRNTPWIVTYESRLPRWGFRTGYRNSMNIRYGLERLASTSCKKIIAMSECAYNLQSSFIRNFPSLNDAILSKMIVVHPAQVPMINHYSEKKCSEQNFVFTIVGHAFFRKGGLAILRAFDFLLDNKHPVELNIISHLSTEASGAKADDVSEAKRIISKHPKQIHCFSELTNNNVIRLLCRTHVALLPSLDETYGFSVLEAQACGCPVITTNIRAFTEINNGQIGWIIDLPLDNEFFFAKTFLQWVDGHNAHDIAAAHTTIRDQLVHIILEIINNPNCIKEKGMLSLERINNAHNPDQKVKLLENIYDSALEI